MMTDLNAAATEASPKVLDLYLIAARRGRYILFGPSDVVAAYEAEAGDRVQKFIQWVMTRSNRVVAWVGRVLNAGHGIYARLEDRIDPVERILKAINGASELTVHHAPGATEEMVQRRFRSLLRRHRIKHAIWLTMDTLIGLVVLALTPILAPIPGPNVFFYYPFLRLLSHYKAMRGTAAGLNSVPVQFKSLPDLSGLEENLQTPRFDRMAIQALASRLKIHGLERFLERMV